MPILRIGYSLPLDRRERHCERLLNLDYADAEAEAKPCNSSKKRKISRGEGSSLYDGVMVSPRFFEAMRQVFDGLDALGIPDQKPDCRCCHTTHQPD
jgi:hypothetical protein